MNEWPRRHAWRNQAAGISRTSVLIDQATGAIAAYVSLAAGQIERAALPKAAQRNRPSAVPIILLGQLAVDRAWQGRGVARSLVFFSFRTAIGASDSLGCFGVVSHPLDEAARAFYRRHGMVDLPGDPRAMIVRIVELRSNGF